MKRTNTMIRLAARGPLAAGVLSLVLAAAVSAQQPGSTVLIDRADKQNITGTTEIAYVWGQQLEPPQNLRRSVINLADAMNTWTNVETSLDRNLMLSDKRIMNVPFVFVTADKRFELTQTEISNLREYFDNGGFMFLDNAEPVSEASASGSMLKRMIEQVIPNARFEVLTNSNEIYKSFFEFDGPPQGAELGIITQSDAFASLSPARHYLEGVYYKGRLAAVYSDKGYVVKWAQDSDNDPQLKMGVNLIIYALTQDGSIATQSYR